MGSNVLFDDALETFDEAPRVQPTECALFTGLSNVPALAELKSRARWVAWKWQERDGKRTKPPIDPHTGGYARTSDCSTWGSYEQAAQRAVECDLPGVGYVLGDDDGDLTGIDLDKCMSASGKPKPWAREILDYRETYAEVSPSGRGIRLLARGKISAAIKFDPAKVELYGGGRYLTITGNQVEGSPDTINDAPRMLTALRERVELHKRTWVALEKAGPDIAVVAREKGSIKQAIAAFDRGERPKIQQVSSENSAKVSNSIHGSPFPKRGALWSDVVRFERREREGDPFFRNVNSAALQCLLTWVPALFPGAKAGNKGYRVSSAILGRDREEDLSFTPQGIKDFGEHDMGDPRHGSRTPIDVVLEYTAADTAADAALWLCDRMGIEPATLGWRGGGAKAESERNDQKLGSRLTYFDDCDQVASKQWIMKGLIARGETSSWIAPPGKGKSALLACLAIHVAAGKDWLKFRSKERCGVLYLAFERGDLTKRRFAAYKRRGFAGLPVAVHAEIIDLMAPECVETILGLMREAEEHYGVQIGLVIIDTYAKGIAIGGGDEDKAKDQGRCLAHLRRVQEASNAHIAIVGHTGKDESRGARGSNAHQGDVDLQVQISGKSAVKTAKVIKGNDQPEGTLLRFSMQSVPLGVDDDGEEITVWIIADEDSSASVTEPREWPAKLGALREAIDEAVIESGFDHTIPHGPTVKAVSLEAVRTIYRRRHPSEVEEGSRRPHRRADNALDRQLPRARDSHLIGSEKVAGKTIVWVAAS
jgi:hypothetical protein